MTYPEALLAKSCKFAPDVCCGAPHVCCGTPHKDAKKNSNSCCQCPSLSLGFAVRFLGLMSSPDFIYLFFNFSKIYLAIEVIKCLYIN